MVVNFAERFQAVVAGTKNPARGGVVWSVVVPAGRWGDTYQYVAACPVLALEGVAVFIALFQPAEAVQCFAHAPHFRIAGGAAYFRLEYGRDNPVFVPVAVARMVGEGLRGAPGGKTGGGLKSMLGHTKP